MEESKARKTEVSDVSEIEENNVRDLLKPFMFTSDCQPSEVRSCALSLARKLIEQLRPEIEGMDRTLFVFVLRGAMLLYPAFADEFMSSSFTFVYSDWRTPVDCSEYDAVIIVDTLINSGKTLFDVKELLKKTGIKTNKLYVASVCANAEIKEKVIENLDKVFCLGYVDYLCDIVDVGQFAACGNGMLTEKHHTVKKS